MMWWVIGCITTHSRCCLKFLNCATIYYLYGTKLPSVSVVCSALCCSDDLVCNSISSHEYFRTQKDQGRKWKGGRPTWLTQPQPASTVSFSFLVRARAWLWVFMYRTFIFVFILTLDYEIVQTRWLSSIAGINKHNHNWTMPSSLTTSLDIIYFVVDRPSFTSTLHIKLVWHANRKWRKVFPTQISQFVRLAK